MIKVLIAMRRVAAIIALLAALVGPSAAQNFVPGFEDLPLIPGLTPLAGSGHIFDTPSGRLIESHAHGSLTRIQVEVFYSESLTPLGWRPAGKGRYQREQEILKIDTSGQDGNLTVIFRLAPERR